MDKFPEDLREMYQFEDKTYAVPRIWMHHILDTFVNKLHGFNRIGIVESRLPVIRQHTSAHGVDNIHPCILFVYGTCRKPKLASIILGELLGNLIELVPGPVESQKATELLRLRSGM